MKPSDTGHGKVALAFTKELAAGNFVKAREYLSGSVRDDLEQEFNEMIDYGEGPVTLVEVMNEMNEWPDKQTNDIGWAYVALIGEGFSEAVSVVVSEVGGEQKISSIEWGRP